MGRNDFTTTLLTAFVGLMSLSSVKCMGLEPEDAVGDLPVAAIGQRFASKSVPAGGGPGCPFSVIANSYDGPGWWGTIGFKNDGPAKAASFDLSFDVPQGVHCDFDGAGWSHTQNDRRAPTADRAQPRLRAPSW